MMQKSDFYYDLPQELIAQTPVEPRDSARLLVANRMTAEFSHTRFFSLGAHLKKGDLLVLNNSKVIPARLYGKKRDTGIDVEFVLLKQMKMDLWETMVRPGRRLKPGTMVDFSPALSAEIMDVVEGGNRIVRFQYTGDFYSVLDKVGNMPLPPYITEKLENKDRYNTIYSTIRGSAAAPTAGLHFTERLMQELQSAGVEIAYVTLHVGLGTFRPVKTNDILQHKMHTEYYSIPAETAKKVQICKQNGGRVIAVGTTSCRTLESACENAQAGSIFTGENETDIFIYPGYQFQIIDGLLTNFHLPESTLIMLVSAFHGKENTLRLYKEAIQARYRFFSFGDAMLIL